jgi:hypothetical protein
MAEPSQLSESPKPSSPRRRWRKRWIALATLTVLLGAGYFTLTNPRVLGSIALWQLGKLAGGTMEASRARVSTDGRVTLENVRLRAPGLTGPASELFTASRIDANIYPVALLRGGRVLDSVTITRPVFRLSQNVTTGQININSLAPAASDPAAKPGPSVDPSLVTPLVTLTQGAIELGEHTDASTFTLLRRIDIEGNIRAAEDSSGSYTALLRQIGAPGSPTPTGGLRIVGTVTTGAVTLEMSGLSLSDWSPEAVPTPLREAYRKLNLSGEVSGATLVYRTGADLAVTIGLLDVALDLPATPQPGEDKDGREIPVPDELSERRLHMEDVKGEITLTPKGVNGTLSGLLEELPFDVTIAYEGAADNSPFTATLISNGFELTSQPRIALFVPGIVRRRLEQFGNPTGTVNAHITISRGAPLPDGSPAEPAVNGRLTLRNGSAAFDRSPYRFFNVSTNAVFTDTTLELQDITGDTPDGALLKASTSISPLTDDAGVTVDVVVTQLPVDNTLAKALRQRGQIIEALFSNQQYERMLAAGLVTRPGEPEKPGVPVFAPGGLGKVTVNVTRKAGPEAIWDDTVTVHFPKVGVLPEAFPYAMEATDVTIHKINYDTKVFGGSYTGLRGGRATMDATVDLLKLDAPDAPFVPNVTIRATDIPTDEFLYFALPSAASLSPDGRPLGDLIRDFHLEGTGDAAVQIGQLEGDDALAYGNTSYDVNIDVSKLVAKPRRTGQEHRITLADLSGKINARHDALGIDLSGNISKKDTTGKAPIAVKADFAYAPRTSSERGDLALRVSAARIDTAINAEDAVAIVAPALAEKLAALRTQHNPSGFLDFATTATRNKESGELNALTTLSRPSGFSFDLLDTRFTLDPVNPAATWRVLIDHAGTQTPGTQNGIVTFTDTHVRLTSNQEPALEALLSGAVSLDLTPVPGSPLNLTLSNIHLQSPVTRALLRDIAPKGIVTYIESNNVSGLLDATLTASALIESDKPLSAPPLWDYSGVISPKSLSAVPSGTDVSIPSLTGDIRFNRLGGSIDLLTITAPLWSSALNSTWESPPGGNINVTSVIALRAQQLAPDLRALLPEELRDILTNLSVSIAGPLEARVNQLDLTYDSSGVLSAFRTNGQLSMDNLGLDSGITISQATAVLDFEASRANPTDPVTFNAWAHCPLLRAGDVQVTDGKLKVTSGDVATIPPTVLIPHFSGDCHGGRITGSATAFPPGPEQRRQFTAQAQGSNIRFASILADIRAAKNLASAEPPNADVTPDGSRGVVDFGLTLTGTASDPSSRRGRGTATITGGRVLSVPLVIPLVRMSNFQLPINEKLEYAHADFFVQGQTVQFEQAWVSSPGVDLIGYGTMQWPEMSVDARVRGKSRRRIPVLTKVIENIRDELFTARITGTAADLNIGFESFSGTGRILERLIGSTPSDADERLRRIEKNADLTPKRNKQIIVEQEGVKE